MLDSFIEEKLLNAYNMASGNTTADSENIGSGTTISVQLVWANLTGTLDAVVKLQQSNDLINWDDMTLSKTLNTASDSTTLDDATFSGKYVRVDVVVNLVTGGTLTAIIIAKD